MTSKRGLATLPAELNTFIGRRQETADVKHELSSSRLVTLTGVGGTGKSRLALHVARELRRAFPDGVWLVELAKLQDPSLLGDTVAASLGLRDLSNRDSETVLVSYLADKQLLLVLDNCEHLLEGCAGLASKLLSTAPRMRVLATSREPLGIAGERVWPVPPLSVPPKASALGAGSGQEYEALALFEERAASVGRGFALNQGNGAMVTRLVQRLDGLPLAIELAAVQLRVLSLEDILARLEDRFRLLTVGNRAAPARHQTLRAAVEWSFDLCTELERTVWARLSVFVGEFDLAAAEEVCSGDGVPVEEVFTGVVGLVDKSLVTKDQDATVARYRMLETIRQYGWEQLGKEKEAMLRRRHRDYYLSLCERAEADWFGPNQVRWLNLLEAEQPNVRAALEFCLTHPGQARTGLRMAGALYWYWMVRALRDGRLWLDRTLACDPEPTHERAKALWADGWVTISGSVTGTDTSRASALLEECSALAERLGDRAALAKASQFMGVTSWIANRFPDAVAHLEKALEQHRAAGAPESTIAMALHHLATGVALLGDADRAVGIAEECIRRCKAHGESWTRSWGLWSLVVARWRQGDYRQADLHASECLRLKRRLNDQLGVPFCVEFLALVAIVNNDAERAAVLLGISDAMWQPISGLRSTGDIQTPPTVFQVGAGGPRPRGEIIPVDLIDQCRARARETLGRPAFEAAYQRGKHFTSDAGAAYALGEPTALPSASTPASELPRLTRREREVAALVAQGMSNKDIAAELVVSQRTAEAHVENILTKLGFTSRTQIAAWIAEQGAS
jgi:predicted ATPase/DNA-binding CsgD family transcriptional regulator